MQIYENNLHFFCFNSLNFLDNDCKNISLLHESIKSGYKNDIAESTGSTCMNANNLENVMEVDFELKTTEAEKSDNESSSINDGRINKKEFIILSEGNKVQESTMKRYDSELLYKENLNDKKSKNKVDNSSIIPSTSDDEYRITTKDCTKTLNHKNLTSSQNVENLNILSEKIIFHKSENKTENAMRINEVDANNLCFLDEKNDIEIEEPVVFASDQIGSTDNGKGNEIATDLTTEEELACSSPQQSVINDSFNVNTNCKHINNAKVGNILTDCIEIVDSMEVEHALEDDVTKCSQGTNRNQGNIYFFKYI